MQKEWDDLVDYGKRYLNIAQESYQIIWWKLFNGPNTKIWSNVLSLAELVCGLPMSNGHLETVFSQLKVIEVEGRSCLGEDRLNQLICISIDAGPLTSQWGSQSSEALLPGRGQARPVDLHQHRCPPPPVLTTDIPMGQSVLGAGNKTSLT